MVQYLAHSANRLRMITAVFGSPSPNIPLDGPQVLRKNTLWVVENTFIGDVMQISEVSRSILRVRDCKEHTTALHDKKTC